MMGERTVLQEALFYSFNLDRHVPMDHLLRSVDRFVDLSGIREHLKPYYSDIGRPSIDPELMIRMLIVGYCFGIRSERRLCDDASEPRLSLVLPASAWIPPVPDHSTFSKARHGRFRDADLLRQMFETVVRRCMAEGLVGGEGFAVDGSLIVADARRQNGVTDPSELKPDASRAVAEYLTVLDDAAFGAATTVQPKFTSPVDPRRTVDGRQPRTCRVRLYGQLPDRSEMRGHHGCRADHRRAAGRSHSCQDHDHPHRRASWHRTRPAGRRHRLWLRRDAGLARRRARDRAAYPGVRQI